MFRGAATEIGTTFRRRVMARSVQFDEETERRERSQLNQRGQFVWLTAFAEERRQVLTAAN